MLDAGVGILRGAMAYWLAHAVLDVTGLGRERALGIIEGDSG
jgi:hypothetical protein